MSLLDTLKKLFGNEAEPAASTTPDAPVTDAPAGKPSAAETQTPVSDPVPVEPETVEPEPVEPEPVEPEEDPETEAPSATDLLMLEYLRSEGLQPKVLDNNDLVFKYQMLAFIYHHTGKDVGYFHLTMPKIHTFGEDVRPAVLEAANKLNIQLKVAKVIVVDNTVWLEGEGIVDSTPKLGDFVPRILDLLIETRALYYKELND